jgi:O-antigen/teichoic acid export membrane protein
MTFEKLLQQSLIWRGFYFITLLMVNIVLSRYLHADGSGWIYYITNAFTFILLVSSLSIDSGYTYYAASNGIKHNKLAWFSIIWTFVIGIIVAVSIAVYFGKIKNIPVKDWGAYKMYAVSYICGILLTNFFTVLFYAHKNFALPNIIMSLINILIVVIISWQAHKGQSIDLITRNYFISFLVQGILLGMVFIFQYKSIQQIALPNMLELKKLFKYSLIALAGNVVFYFVYRIDYWFVRYNTVSCTPEDLGNYIQASKLGQLLLVVPQIMASAIFPQTASGTLRNDVNKSIIVLFRIFIVVFLAAIVVISMVGNWLIPFVFGVTFNNVTIPLLLLLPGIFGIAVLVLLSAYFSGKGKVRINVEGALIALIVVIIGDIIFIPKYGIYAAAIVSTIGYLVNLCYALWHFFNDYNLTWKEVLHFETSDWLWVKNMLLNKKNEL